MDSFIRIKEKYHSIDDLLADVIQLTKTVRHFKTGKLDNYGNVVGIKEIPPGQIPFVHQDHFYDDLDRVIKLEKYENDFSKPVKRVYFYNPGELKVVESIWFDRYENIDNIHRYLYDSVSGLMIQRAEYTKEGQIFYTISSKYDEGEPPHLISETWNDTAGKMIKRLEYKYDESGEMIEERRFDSSNVLQGYNQFSYDERGNLIERSWINYNGVNASTFLYAYDENDDVMAVSIYDEEGNMESWQEFLRDEIGNLLEERWYDKDRKLLRHVKY